MIAHDKIRLIACLSNKSTARFWCGIFIHLPTFFSFFIVTPITLTLFSFIILLTSSEFLRNALQRPTFWLKKDISCLPGGRSPFEENTSSLDKISKAMNPAKVLLGASKNQRPILPLVAKDGIHYLLNFVLKRTITNKLRFVKREKK